MDIWSQPTIESSTPPTDDDICNEVLGRRPNYIMGLGYAVVALSSSRASHVSCDAHLYEVDVRRREVERRHEEEMRWAEKECCRSQEDIAALQRANIELTSQLAAFGAKLDELYHYIPLPLTFDVLTDVYDDDSTDNDDGCPPMIDIILYYF